MKTLIAFLIALAFCSTAHAQMNIWAMNNDLQGAYNMGQGYAYRAPVYYRSYYQPRYYAPRYYGGGGYGYGGGRLSRFDVGMMELENQQHMQNIEFQLRSISNQQQLDSMRLR